MTFSIAFGAVLRRVHVLHRPGVTFGDCNWGTTNMSRCRSAAISDIQNLKFFNVHRTRDERNRINIRKALKHKLF